MLNLAAALTKEHARYNATSKKMHICLEIKQKFIAF